MSEALALVMARLGTQTSYNCGEIENERFFFEYYVPRAKIQEVRLFSLGKMHKLVFGGGSGE